MHYIIQLIAYVECMHGLPNHYTDHMHIVIIEEYDSYHVMYGKSTPTMHDGVYAYTLYQGMYPCKQAMLPQTMLP